MLNLSASFPTKQLNWVGCESKDKATGRVSFQVWETGLEVPPAYNDWRSKGQGLPPQICKLPAFCQQLPNEGMSGVFSY